MQFHPVFLRLASRFPSAGLPVVVMRGNDLAVFRRLHTERRRNFVACRPAFVPLCRSTASESVRLFPTTALSVNRPGSLLWQSMNLFLPVSPSPRLIVLACCALLNARPDLQAQAADLNTADGSVTTQWLPDPFPNVAPRVLDRQVTVEMNTASRTPSVLLGVYDAENDPVSLATFTKPAHGALTANPDGAFTYTPQRGFLGDDHFTFTLSDGRGGSGTATMHLKVIQPTGQWSTTSFIGLVPLEAGGKPIHFSSAVTPRAIDWDGDGLMDLLVGAEGGVTWFRNVGTPQAPVFAAGVAVEAGGRRLQFGRGRLTLAWVDMDRDGKRDLVLIAEDRKVRWARNLATAAGQPVLAEPMVIPAQAGGDFIADNIRADIADWNGDGLPDVLTGSGSGAVKISYNVGTAAAPKFAPPGATLDTEGRTIEGSYNLNIRIADLNQDGVPDFVDSYNWGTINFRVNTGSRVAPRLPATGTFSVAGPASAKLDLHALTDGPLVDFADFNGDGTIDLVCGGEVGGTVRLGFGESGRSYLREIAAILEAHPQDLGMFLANPVNAAAKLRMIALQGALYDYVTTLATPSQKEEIRRGLLAVIAAHPQYLKLQAYDLKQQPGISSLAVQMWLTTLLADYDNPAARRALADAAQFTGGYRKLVQDVGLIYADNAQNPRGAEAIYQWVRTIPREIYPGTGITAADWLGPHPFLVRGHLKNTFNGSPVNRGEYGFGKDARAVIGDRGSENWFMTVVHHEACHDVDAYVRKSATLGRRWGQVLVRAGGPDMRADPQTGWLSWELTKNHFRECGLWDGVASTWDAAWKKYWAEGPGAEWNQFGFMRGNISWFYGAPQESLATQGNQFWNSTEGRIEVALDRWKRGFKSNLAEVLFFMEVWSLGFDKMKFCENDDACRQVFSFAQLRRNRDGFIDRVDLSDRFYEFAVDTQGAVTALVHVPDKLR